MKLAIFTRASEFIPPRPTHNYPPKLNGTSRGRIGGEFSYGWMHVLRVSSSVRARVSHIDLQYRKTYALLALAGKGYDRMDATMQSRWMTLREVAEYLQLSKDMIYRLAQSGRIPASKVGSRWRFRQERIDRWMDDIDVNTDAPGRRKDVRE